MCKKHLLGALVLLLIFCGTMNAKEKPDKLAKMEKEIEAYLGTAESWKAKIFADLAWEMPCEEVRKFFKAVPCSTGKEYDFPEIAGNFGKVSNYAFTFHKGKLQDASIIFGARLFDEKRFKTALLMVAQRKWGMLEPDKLAGDRFIWSNSDMDQVLLSYNSTHWELKNGMPHHDSGLVIAATLDEATLREELQKLAGSKETYNMAAIYQFRRNMTCEEVSKIYPAMSGQEPSKKWSWGEVTIIKHPLIHRLKFTFENGLLQSGTIIFHRQLAKDLFKSLSLAMMDEKWGGISADKREEDVVTLIKGKSGMVQRTYMVDHWEITQEFAAVAGPKAAPTAAATGGMSNDAAMKEFLKGFGSHKAVTTSLARFAVAGLETDMGLYDLMNPKIVRTKKSGARTCYSISTKAGVTTRFWIVCWEKGQIVSVEDKMFKLD